MEDIQQRPFRLFKLPQELQDLIFDLAYPQEDMLSITFKDDWESGERMAKKQDRQNYQVRPLPTYELNDWMISERYFILAAKSWIGSQHHGSNASNGRVHTSCIASPFLVRQKGLFLDFAREMSHVRTYLLADL